MLSRRLLLLTSALFVSSAAAAQAYVPAINPSCVVPSFVNGEDRYTNTCGREVYAVVIFGYQRTGAWGMVLKDGESGGTVHSAADTERLGGAYVHVCPAGARVVDMDGKPVYRVPAKEYKCAVSSGLITRFIGADTLDAADTPTGAQAQTVPHTGGTAASASGSDLERQALQKLAAASPSRPTDPADLEKQALESMAGLQKAMAEAQARMDAQARGEHVPAPPVPSVVTFSGDASDSGAAATPVTGSPAAGDPIQQAAQQQLQTIQQVGNTLQRQQQAAPHPAPASSATAGKSGCEHPQPGMACLAK